MITPASTVSTRNPLKLTWSFSSGPRAPVCTTSGRCRSHHASASGAAASGSAYGGTCTIELCFAAPGIGHGVVDANAVGEISTYVVSVRATIEPSWR